jgi:hypothetical protein
MSKRKNRISKKLLRQMTASGMEERKRIRAMTEYPFFLGRLRHQPVFYGHDIDFKR